MSDVKGLMAGKRGLIMGVANNRSIAYSIAKACSDAGAEIALTRLLSEEGSQRERTRALADDASHVNPNGGAIAMGHPLGMSGARLVTTAAYELRRRGGRYALCTMCIGVGQGIAMVIERV